MSLLDAVVATGPLPPDSTAQAQKKRYSEILSSHLAVEVAEELRANGFQKIKPAREGPGERAFQGGLGPKKGEKFENVTMMLFQPVIEAGPEPWLKLIDTETELEMTEEEYFLLLRNIYNKRNPHMAIDEENGADEEE